MALYQLGHPDELLGKKLETRVEILEIGPGVRLGGLVVRAPVCRAVDPGSKSGDWSGVRLGGSVSKTPVRRVGDSGSNPGAGENFFSLN